MSRLFRRKSQDTAFPTQKYENVRKELDEIMGGKILEFKGEKIYKQGANDNARETAERMLRDGKLSDARKKVPDPFDGC